ncbi:response regulator transcription factor [Thauera aromatica]|nr:response regulator transcription factor [Thauera aromatica]MCK2127225.1 response regulator transcription factor [Thauera aromatica]
MKASSIRVLLVDDHTLFRSGIRSLLQSYPEFEVVGEAGDGREGIHLAAQFRPDVVLLDLNMPGLSGCEAARLILEESPGSRVLMLTVSEDADDLIDTLRVGACGYLLKNIQAETLVSAINTAAQGESVVSPQMMGKLLNGVRGAAAQEARGSARNERGAAGAAPAAAVEGGDLDKLSPREREILQYIARGQSNKEIARALDVAESTVKIHVQNMLRKLNLSSRVQAAVYAVENGLVQTPDT